jgi:hypothetical protein
MPYRAHSWEAAAASHITAGAELARNSSRGCAWPSLAQEGIPAERSPSHRFQNWRPPSVLAAVAPIGSGKFATA